MERTVMEEYSFRGYGENIYGCILMLKEYNAMGISVYMDINGKVLYSCDVTSMDRGCELLRGETWEQLKEPVTGVEKATMQYLIERGKNCIHPKKMKDWEEFVDVITRVGKNRWKPNGGIEDLKLVLEIIEELGSEEVREVAGRHKDVHRDVRRIILHFARKGEEFYKETSKGGLTVLEREQIEYREKENERLEKDTQKKGRDEAQRQIGKSQENIEILKRQAQELEGQISELKAMIAELENGKNGQNGQRYE